MRHFYRLFHSTAGSIDVTPQNGVTLSFKRVDKSQRIFTVAIKGGLTIAKEFFSYLAGIENGPDRCLPITIEVIRRADNIVVYSGKTYCDRCSFDFNSCVGTMQFETQGGYSDFIDKWKTPVNILSGTTKVGAYVRYSDHGFSEIEIMEDVQTLSIGFPGNQQFPNSGWPDPFDGWAMIYDQVKVIQDPFNIVAQRTTRWAREVAITTPLPSFQFTGNDTVRLFPSVLKSDNTTTLTFGITPGEWYYDEYERAYAWLPLDYSVLNNGVLFADAVNRILLSSGISLSVVSDFFQINPDNTAPSNDAYGKKQPNLVLYQRTDIKRPAASQPATVCRLSLSGLSEILWAKYQVQMVVRGSTLRIEHVSYFDAEQGVDLVNDYPEALNGTSRYTYRRDEIPVGEYWYEESETACLPYFQRWQFTYRVPSGLEIPENCVPGYTDEESHPVSGNVSDIQSVNAQPDIFQDEGICIVETTIYSGNRYVVGNRFINGTQSLQNLQVLLYYRRYLPYAVYIVPNSADYYYFLSVIRTKQQEQFGFRLKELESFNAEKSILSQYGWGEVQSAEYDLEGAWLTIQLNHT